MEFSPNVFRAEIDDRKEDGGRKSSREREAVKRPACDFRCDFLCSFISERELRQKVLYFVFVVRARCHRKKVQFRCPRVGPGQVSE